jgi:hypothetical protein
VAAFRPAHICAFLKVIADSGGSLGTRPRRSRETRAFFSWCARIGDCERHPFTDIPNVRIEQKVIQPLSASRSGMGACGRRGSVNRRGASDGLAGDPVAAAPPHALSPFRQPR